MLAPEPLSAGPVSVLSSLAVNLSCRLCSSLRASAGGHLAQEFWDDGEGCGEELIILAQRGGALATSSFDELIAVVSARPALGPAPRMASESEAMRTVLAHRLDLLRRSAKRRAGYLEMLEELWEGFRDAWQGRGDRSTERAADRYRTRLDAGVRWQDLAPNAKVDSFMPGFLNKVGYDIPVTLVPALTYGRMFVFDIDDAVVVAVPGAPPTSERGTEELSRQLKALGHPARLAMIRDLALRPRSVGELAQAFDLAQPTVTNHVKSLRDAGLLHNEDGPGRRPLRVDTDTVRAVLSELSTLVDLGPTVL
ncbi:MAG: helix-turn-helix domain-containing protein [Actinomycetota bacterium]|nr:helix-turn-helix domain-containing protein [Actinomycetota bacterium]